MESFVPEAFTAETKLDDARFGAVPDSLELLGDHESHVHDFTTALGERGRAGHAPDSPLGGTDLLRAAWFIEDVSSSIHCGSG